MTPDAGAPGEGWNNGLIAASYVALTDVTPTVGKQVLVALKRSRIAAYLALVGDPGAERLRLFVAAAERSDARTVVAAVVRENADALPTDALPADAAPTEAVPADAVAAEASDDDAAASPSPVDATDPLAGIDTDAAFAALIADWHVDTHTAIREAERDLSREDEDWRMRLARPAAQADDDLPWLDDDHYVPPTPPPIPRPTGPIVLGLTLVALSILLLALGGFLGLQFEVRLFLAVCGILSATGVFVTRLRAHRDEDDDGAIL